MAPTTPHEWITLKRGNGWANQRCKHCNAERPVRWSKGWQPPPQDLHRSFGTCPGPDELPLPDPGIDTVTLR